MTKRAAESTPVESAKVSKLDGLGWQVTKASMQEKLAHICDSGLYSDVHFVVGQAKQRFSAHKLVLSVGSTVFEKMFNQDWVTDKDIEVPDIEPVPFSALLKFLYYDHLAITTDSAFAILYAARKYAVLLLENHCVSFIIKNILCASNVFSILPKAEFYEIPKLIESCFEVVDYCMEEAVRDEAFTNINLDTLCFILRRNSLTISEPKLFQAIIRWAAAECTRQGLNLNVENQLSVLKDALYLIRFPLMTLDQFAAHMAESGLLEDKEFGSTLLCCISKMGPTVFCSYPRLGSYLVARRFQFTSESAFLCNNSQETVSFHTDHAINLAGIVFYGPQEGVGDYDLDIAVYNCYNLSYSHDTYGWRYTSIDKKFRFLFDPSLKLLAGKTYKIEFKLKGPPTIQGSEDVKEVLLRKPGPGDQEIKLTFVTPSKFSKQISDLLFEL